MTTPISSQWPAIVSLPFERSSSRPATAGRAGLRRAALERLDVAEPESLEVGEIEPSDGAGHVAERVRSLVAVLGRIRKRPGPNRVQHDDAGARHAAILIAAWTPPSA